MTFTRAGSAISAGVPTRLIASRKVMMHPASSAGSTSGSVTFSAVRTVPAPRMLAASSISLLTTSSADCTKMNRNGKV